MVIPKQKPEKNVSIWQPMKELEEMGRRFDESGRPALRAMWRRMPMEEALWAPAVDVVEKEDKFLVKVELPGVKDEDIDISITGDTLTISGEKSSDSEVKKKGYYYSESSYGSFSRSITIPSSVNMDKIEAVRADGVLEINLPKIPEITPKKVTVAVKKKVEKSVKKGQKTTISKKEAVASKK